MEQAYPVVEFDAEVGADGTIRIPENLRGRVPADGRIVVRMTSGSVLAPLREHGVTEEEVERIAAMQREERESVIGFLQAEGALRHNAGFAQRGAALLGITTPL